MRVVPDHRNGSKTMSPTLELLSIALDTRPTGFIVGCRSFMSVFDISRTSVLVQVSFRNVVGSSVISTGSPNPFLPWMNWDSLKRVSPILRISPFFDTRDGSLVAHSLISRTSLSRVSP